MKRTSFRLIRQFQTLRYTSSYNNRLVRKHLGTSQPATDFLGKYHVRSSISRPHIGKASIVTSNKVVLGRPLLRSLAAQVKLPAWRDALRQGEWQRSPHFCLLDYAMPQILGSTLAIIGHGVLGREVEKSAQALGMRVLIAERPGQADQPGGLIFFLVTGRA
ncbi:MAG: hypothetical protein KJ914_06830 [Gammaproteobacteria bacterium]|nr:hypothetical protein [Gammaproteobacteria bacterium]MBU1725176.1 hypothetical protein [Gammaproteobacteria bacterium]MBU2005130.1 hypothetical protein [Gammaproteobacteria bacterium]